MKIFLIIVSVLVGLFLIFLLIGVFAPKSFKGERTATLSGSRTKIWGLLNDIEGLPRRRKEITKVEMMGTNEKGYKKWREYTDMGGHIDFEVVEEVPEQKLVLRMIESSFGMKGTWSYDLAGEGTSTIVRISEESEIDNLFIRSIMTLTGRDANLKREFELLENGVKS